MALSANLFFAISAVTLAVVLSKHGSEGRYLVKNVYETPPKTEKLVTVSNITIRLPDGRLGHGVKKVTTYVTKWNSTTEYVNLTSVGPGPEDAQSTFGDPMAIPIEVPAPAKPQTETHTFEISDISPDLKLDLLDSFDFGSPFPAEGSNFGDAKLRTNMDSTSPSELELELNTETPKDRKKKEVVFEATPKNVRLPEANDAENGIEIDLTTSAAPPSTPGALQPTEDVQEPEPELLLGEELPPQLVKMIDFTSLLTPGSTPKPEQPEVSLQVTPQPPISQVPVKPKPELAPQTPVSPTPGKAAVKPKTDAPKTSGQEDSPLVPILEGLLSTMDDILQAPLNLLTGPLQHHQRQLSNIQQQQRNQRPLAPWPSGPLLQHPPSSYRPDPQQRPLPRHPLASSATRSYFRLPVLPPAVPGGAPGVWNVHGNTMVENRPLQNPFGLGPLGQMARMHHVLNYDWQGNDRYRFGQWRFDMPYPRPLAPY